MAARAELRAVWSEPKSRECLNRVFGIARHAVTSMTAGLPSASDAPLQRGELARSARSGSYFSFAHATFARHIALTVHSPAYCFANCMLPFRLKERRFLVLAGE